MKVFLCDRTRIQPPTYYYVSTFSIVLCTCKLCTMSRWLISTFRYLLVSLPILLIFLEWFTNALVVLLMIFKPISKTLQKIESSHHHQDDKCQHLGIFEFLSQYRSFSQICLLMVLTMLPMVFKAILKTLQKLEICVLGAKDTNTNSWVTLKIAQNVFILLKCFEWCCQNFCTCSYGKELYGTMSLAKGRSRFFWRR